VTLTIFLADDHQIVRQGLKAILDSEPDFCVVGEAADGLLALRAVEKHDPDILVLDLMMPCMDGIEVSRQMTERFPRTRVVVLSMHSDEAYVRTAFSAGVRAYVLKEAGVQELVQAIRKVMAGGKYVSPPLCQELSETTTASGDAALQRDSYDSLTVREREVFLLTAEGYTGGEISRRLFISPRTVESHRSNLMRKLRIRNQKELVRYAVEHRLLPGGKANEKGD
jgi:two-component system, NarL family, response regulator NreC